MQVYLVNPQLGRLGDLADRDGPVDLYSRSPHYPTIHHKHFQ